MPKSVLGVRLSCNVFWNQNFESTLSGHEPAGINISPGSRPSIGFPQPSILCFPSLAAPRPGGFDDDDDDGDDHDDK